MPAGESRGCLIYVNFFDDKNKQVGVSQPTSYGTLTSESAMALNRLNNNRVYVEVPTMEREGHS